MQRHKWALFKGSILVKLGRIVRQIWPIFPGKFRYSPPKVPGPGQKPYEAEALNEGPGFPVAKVEFLQAKIHFCSSSAKDPHLGPLLHKVFVQVLALLAGNSKVGNKKGAKWVDCVGKRVLWPFPAGFSFHLRPEPYLTPKIPFLKLARRPRLVAFGKMEICSQSPLGTSTAFPTRKMTFFAEAFQGCILRIFPKYVAAHQIWDLLWRRSGAEFAEIRKMVIFGRPRSDATA